MADTTGYNFDELMKIRKEAGEVYNRIRKISLTYFLAGEYEDFLNCRHGINRQFAPQDLDWLSKLERKLKSRIKSKSKK